MRGPKKRGIVARIKGRYHGWRARKNALSAQYVGGAAREFAQERRRPPKKDWRPSWLKGTPDFNRKLESEFRVKAKQYRQRAAYHKKLAGRERDEES